MDTVRGLCWYHNYLWQNMDTKQTPGKAPTMNWLLNAAAQASFQSQTLKGDLTSHSAC